MSLSLNSDSSKQDFVLSLVIKHASDLMMVVPLRGRINLVSQIACTNCHLFPK